MVTTTAEVFQQVVVPRIPGPGLDRAQLVEPGVVDHMDVIVGALDESRKLEAHALAATQQRDLLQPGDGGGIVFIDRQDLGHAENRALGERARWW
jgi:hypothetical protein